ncbi:MAG: hypothetical protein M1274_03095 [Actinobacteria bacterium]|nr:hypothetical protein [Actinomycetota bacterium]
MKDRRHLFLWPVLVIGIALIVIPFAMSMPGKTNAAQSMLDDFRPIMKAASVAKTVDYYYDTFVKLGPVTEARQALEDRVPQLIPIFAKVVPAVIHFKPVVDAMQANVTNFQELDSLPSFSLLTWFFVIPGIMLVLLAAVPLGMGFFKRRPEAQPPD